MMVLGFIRACIGTTLSQMLEICDLNLSQEFKGSTPSVVKFQVNAKNGKDLNDFLVYIEKNFTNIGDLHPAIDGDRNFIASEIKVSHSLSNDEGDESLLGIEIFLEFGKHFSPECMQKDQNDDDRYSPYVYLKHDGVEEPLLLENKESSGAPSETEEEEIVKCSKESLDKEVNTADDEQHNIVSEIIENAESLTPQEISASGTNLVGNSLTSIFKNDVIEPKIDEKEILTETPPIIDERLGTYNETTSTIEWNESLKFFTKSYTPEEVWKVQDSRSGNGVPYNVKVSQPNNLSEGCLLTDKTNSPDDKDLPNDSKAKEESESNKDIHINHLSNNSDCCEYCQGKSSLEENIETKAENDQLHSHQYKLDDNYVASFIKFYLNYIDFQKICFGGDFYTIDAKNFKIENYSIVELGLISKMSNKLYFFKTNDKNYELIIFSRLFDKSKRRIRSYILTSQMNVSTGTLSKKLKILKVSDMFLERREIVLISLQYLKNIRYHDSDVTFAPEKINDMDTRAKLKIKKHFFDTSKNLFEFISRFATRLNREKIEQKDGENIIRVCDQKVVKNARQRRRNRLGTRKKKEISSVLVKDSNSDLRSINDSDKTDIDPKSGYKKEVPNVENIQKPKNEEETGEDIDQSKKEPKSPELKDDEFETRDIFINNHRELASTIIIFLCIIIGFSVFCVLFDLYNEFFD